VLIGIREIITEPPPRRTAKIGQMNTPKNLHRARALGTLARQGFLLL
jgi:hypothetical protein